MKAQIASNQRHQIKLARRRQQVFNTLPAVGERLFNEEMASPAGRIQGERQMQRGRQGHRHGIRLALPSRLQVFERIDAQL